MPFYNYKCYECEHTFNELQKIDDRRIPCDKPCPSCGVQGKVDMLISAPGFSDPVRLGLKKPDAEFRNLIDTIKKNTGNA